MNPYANTDPWFWLIVMVWIGWLLIWSRKH
jgi:hypothetical protein